MKSLIGIFLCLTASLSFAEDWPTFGGDSLHTRFAPETTDTLYQDLLWSYQAGGPIFSSPVVQAHTVYFASIDNYIYAAVDSTGEIKWRCKLGSWIEATPAVANGLVYVGCMDHKIYAIDIETGDIVWEYKTTSWIESSPLVVNDAIYIGGTDHLFYCLDALSGEKKWTFSAAKDIYSSPAFFEGMIYFGSDDGCLYAIDTNGQLVWKYDTGGYSIYASPSVGDSIVVVGTIDNGVKAGRTQNKIGSLHNEILGLDAFTGKVKWKVPAEAFGLMHASPAVAYGKVFYPTDQAHLRAIDLKDGHIHWETVVPDSSMIWASPAVAAGVVYVTTYQGNLYLFDADSGKVLGQFTVTDENAYIHSSPAIANNFLYFGDSNGKLYVFGKLIPTSVSLLEKNNPENYTLSQNYPNPFNQRTQIQYILLKPAHVKINVYNSMGQLIRTLVREHQSPGSYQIHWDGKDRRGSDVASGMYTCRFEADNFVRSQRMILLK